MRRGKLRWNYRKETMDQPAPSSLNQRMGFSAGSLRGKNAEITREKSKRGAQSQPFAQEPFQITERKNFPGRSEGQGKPDSGGR